MENSDLFDYTYAGLQAPCEVRKQIFEEKYVKIKKRGFDVVKLARELGINVFKTDDFEDDRISGMLEYDGFSFNMYLNSKNSLSRNIFTIAHEIAHFICDFEEIKKGIKFRDGNYKVKLNEQEIKMEVRANRMAADMLMPKKEFIELWNEGKSLKELSKIFKVSEDALKVRANYLLGIIL